MSVPLKLLYICALCISVSCLGLFLCYSICIDNCGLSVCVCCLCLELFAGCKLCVIPLHLSSGWTGASLCVCCPSVLVTLCLTMCCLYNWVSLCVCGLTVLACLCWSLPGHVCVACWCLCSVCCPSTFLVLPMSTLHPGYLWRYHKEWPVQMDQREKS